MPKSVARRKRIRTARSQAAPTSRPEETQAGERASSAAPVAPAAKKAGKDKEKDKDSREKQLHPVLQKLNANTPSDRLWSLSAISHILAAADTNTRRALQSKNVVGLLIERLQDAQLECQVEATGALRNLAIEGGSEVCAEMFNKSVLQAVGKHLQPLNAALASLVADQKPANDGEKRVRKFIWPWIENLATLFWCLAETSDKAFKAVVAMPDLSNLLYTVLRHAIPADGAAATKCKIPLGVALAAAQAVYVLTDGNVPSAPKFPLPRDVSLAAAHTNTRGMLLEILRHPSPESGSDSKQKGKATEDDESQQTFSILCIGILQNLSQQTISRKNAGEKEEMAEFTALALPLLTRHLQAIDLSRDAACALEAYKTLPAASTSISAEAASISAQRRALDAIDARWTRTRLSLEILAELVAELDGIVDIGLLGAEQYEEWTGIAPGEDNVANGMDEDNPAPALDNVVQTPAPIPSDTINILASLPASLLALAQPTLISFSPPSARPAQKVQGDDMLISTQVEGRDELAQEEQHGGRSYVPNMTEAVSLLHSRALECLNNLFITFGRSNSTSDNEALPASPEMVEENADMDMLDGPEEGENGDVEDEDEDGDDALPDEMAEAVLNGHSQENALEAYISTNVSSLQAAWETLFTLLVNYLETQQSLLGSSLASSANINGSNKKGKGKAAATEEEDPCALSVEAALGSIWALGRLCIDRIVVGQSETPCLLRVLEAGSDADIAVRCVGALGVLAMRKGVTVAENEAIGTALLGQLSSPGRSNKPEETAELHSHILDTVFDIYGDETREYDGLVFVQRSFLKVLKDILPDFQKQIKSIDRRKHPETRAQADAALANLQEFLKYRKSLQ